MVIQSFLHPGHEVFYLNLLGLLTGPILITTGATILTSTKLDAHRYRYAIMRFKRINKEKYI